MNRIPSDVLDVQRAAPYPAVSAWVSANAGSGKTHVLVQRVIRLLLNDVSPEMREDPLVKEVSDQLGQIEKLVSFPPGKAPTVEDVRKVNEAVGHVMEQIQHKPDAQ